MFRTAELGQKVPKAEFKKRQAVLRRDLLETQREMRDLAAFPVLIDFAGVDGAGKGAMLNTLNMWMDPRFIDTHAYPQIAGSAGEQRYPRFWRFWRDLPANGQIGLYLSGRYSQPLLDHVHGRISAVEFDKWLAEINNFERTLANDGALILKFWMHLSRDQQKKRLKKLESDPALSYRVTETDWDNWEKYDTFIETAESIITRTNTGAASWSIVEGADSNYRTLTVGEEILSALKRHIKRTKTQKAAAAQAASQPADEAEPGEDTHEFHRTIFSKLDMTRTLEKPEYKKKLKPLQARLGELGRRARRKGQSSIIVIEGPDAGGKGGAIRRIIWSLDARHYKVQQIAAPTEEERMHHYLWRFWERLNEPGRLTIFDRSWYGRVLVERVENFATENEWRRAYGEINDFEQQLLDHGILLVKFWFHITSDEQLARFEARKDTPYKRWKLTEEDWRNREKWEAYETAANDMIEYTSTSVSPWHLIEGNDKYYARIKALKIYCDALESHLD